MADWQELEQALAAASGGDHAIDTAVATAFGQAAAAYSQSVEACRTLVAAVLPGWKLHVGYDVAGLFPYAALSRGDSHVEAAAPTLPLAILRAAVAANRSA